MLIFALKGRIYGFGIISEAVFLIFLEQIIFAVIFLSVRFCIGKGRWIYGWCKAAWQ